MKVPSVAAQLRIVQDLQLRAEGTVGVNATRAVERVRVVDGAGKSPVRSGLSFGELADRIDLSWPCPRR